MKLNKVKCTALMLLSIAFNSNAGEIGKDKYMHLAATAAISATLKFSGYSEKEAFWYTLSVGLSKEAYDKFSGKGNAEVGDMVANAIGAYIGSKSNFTFEVVKNQFETINTINYKVKF